MSDNGSTTRGPLELRVASIVLAAVNEEAAAEQVAELNQLLLNHRELIPFVVDLVSQESWLSWHSTKSSRGTVRKELLEQISQVVQSSEVASLAAAPVVDSREKHSAGGHAATVTATPYNKLSLGGRGRSLPLQALAAGLLLATGLALGIAWDRWHTAPHGAAVAERAGVDSGQSAYVAHLVQGSACLWNSELNSAVLGNDNLRIGESLSLLEGIAELQVEWDTGKAGLKIEGPAGLVLTADRGASLSHGNVTADVLTSGSRFSLSTPNGVIEVSVNASLGVSVVGNDLELHLFRGSASLVAPGSSGIEDFKRFEVTEGNAILLTTDPEGRTSVEWSVATPSNFISRVSMGSDNLLISRQYVAEVLQAEPLVYWRFEDRDPQVVSNEVGTDYQGRIVGAAEYVDYPGNHSLDMGGALNDQAFQTYLLCEQPLPDRFAQGYTIELWLKPSHYHWGSLVTLLQDSEESGSLGQQGFLLEIGGPRSVGSIIERPGKLRFLHRNPPSVDPAGGTSIFSNEAYEPRKWQHVVAVKDGNRMQLYINGQLVAQGDDDSELAGGMKLLLGQLDERQFYRRFVGQIDEFAVYQRSLTEQEISRHFELTRPRPPRNSEPELHRGQTAKVIIQSLRNEADPA